MAKLKELNGVAVIPENRYVDNIGQCNTGHVPGIIRTLVQTDLLTYANMLAKGKEIPYNNYGIFLTQAMNLINIEDLINRRDSNTWNYFKYILNSSLRQFALMNQLETTEQEFALCASNIISTCERIDQFFAKTKIINK